MFCGVCFPLAFVRTHAYAYTSCLYVYAFDFEMTVNCEGIDPVILFQTSLYARFCVCKTPRHRTHICALDAFFVRAT